MSKNEIMSTLHMYAVHMRGLGTRIKRDCISYDQKWALGDAEKIINESNEILDKVIGKLR